jgi:hypothetical protein
MNNCSTCRHWDRSEDVRCQSLIHPDHPDTYKALTEQEIVKFHGHLLGQCKHPKLLFFNYPEKGAAAVVDGSQYMAALITSEAFGCVLYEPKSSL